MDINFEFQLQNKLYKTASPIADIERLTAYQ